MRKALIGAFGVMWVSITSLAQVDTTFVYSNNKPYGSLDIRISKSANNYYYLNEGKTFSFRESAPGVKTDTYRDMTAWDSSPYGEGHLREKNTGSDTFVMNYRFLVPQDYDENYQPGYPLIIVFHGLGERGNCWDSYCYHAGHEYNPLDNNPPAPTAADHELLNNDHQLSNGGAVHLHARNLAGGKRPDDNTLHARAFPGFVLFPQNLNGWDIKSTQDALRLLRLFIKKYNIDQDRVYIHGLSNGGQGVYEAIKRAPWMFAAAITMSAIGDANIIQQNMAGAVAHIPLWVFQGAQDTNPYPQKTENYVRQFRDAGMVVRYTKYDHLGHGTWNTAYNEPDFFTWLLGRNRSEVHAFAGSPLLCGSQGVELRMPEGFHAYEWQLNGSTISGANDASHHATQPGKYRGRYARVANPTGADWNPWSAELEVKQGEALPAAAIHQIGTVVLRDPNNNANARLRAEGEFNQYYWYKDGNLIDFPGTQDDTIRSPILTPAMGNGAYTLVTSNYGGCKSPPAPPVYVFFNNSAPLNITAPSNLVATPKGPSVTLTWADNSGNEGSFEIWRRHQTPQGAFTSWTLAALTAANTTSFNDVSLLETTTYEYRIRAVSATGRSDYFPASSAVSVQTETDEEAPTAPANFSATMIGVQRARLSWAPSTDNALLRDYVIEYGGVQHATHALDTTFVLSGLPLNESVSLTVRARDAAGNLSDPSEPGVVNTAMAGLYYQHSTGFVEVLDSVRWDVPEFTGRTLTFSLEPKTQEDYFNFRFDGFLFITQAGTYQFRLTSDDGSRMYLDGQRIINNDGIHELATVASNNQNLSAGPHRIMVDFFDYIETDSLSVQYRGPDTGNAWIPVTVDVLKSDESVVTSVEDPAHRPMTLSVYPNPSSMHTIHVKVETFRTSPVSIQLLDPAGRRVLTEVFEADRLADGIVLTPSGTLTTGIYLVVARQEDITDVVRVVVKE